MHTRSSRKRTKLETEPEKGLEEQKKLVMQELGTVIELESHAFARSLYHDLASNSSIESFLKTSRFYSLRERRWKIPQNLAKLLDSNYCTPFRNIVASVVRHFWRDATRQGCREVVDTHATDLQHCLADPPAHTSRPSLVIKAKGPSFQLPCVRIGQSLAKIGFSNTAACIEIQPEGGELPVSEQLARAAIYARQIFVQQPNRRYARVLGISGHHLRLFHFDRSGAQYTPPLDFNDDPHTLVRIIIGLSSPNEAVIGLDTSIQWQVENGRKVGGTLTTRAANDTEKVYPLVYLDPLFTRFHLYGRGTTCWTVSDPGSSDRLLVKDSWRSEDTTAEHVHLQDALDVPGVAQMVSFEPERGQTQDLRLFEHGNPPTFHNRIECRIVMKSYTQPIIHFTSAKQLLCALRDAISGHKTLFQKGTLHRDIWIQNILLGIPGANPGERGVLIDLDMASRRDRYGNHPLVNWQIGIPLYQSVMVLHSAELEEDQVLIPHDYLDDLESFFYVLTCIVYTYDCHGVSYPANELLKRWQKITGSTAATAKEVFLTRRRFIPDPISRRWPQALLDVFFDFRIFLLPLVQEKIAVMEMEAEDPEECLKQFAFNAEQNYDEVLRIFDAGIEALEKADNECPVAPQEVPKDSLASSVQQRSLAGKRSRSSEADSQPVAKRHHLSPERL